MSMRGFYSFKAIQPILAVLILLSSAFSGLTPAQAQVPERAEQMILVISPEWQAVQGRMMRYERKRGAWQKVGDWLPVNLGRKGLGWGRGLFSASDVLNAGGSLADFRIEGDERSPAGVFRLCTLFGLASKSQAEQWLNLKMPYLPLSNSVRCIGDASSSHYNQLIDLLLTPDSGKHPEANEYMRLDALRDEGAYRWGIFVAHNSDDKVNGLSKDRISGSCIFIHIWKAPGIGTSGCTALSKDNLLKIINWLDVQKQPVLVQLSQTEYQRLKRSWDLPEITD